MGRYTKVFALPMGKKQHKLNWQDRQPKKERTTLYQRFETFMFYAAVPLAIIFLVCITQNNTEIVMDRDKDSFKLPDEPPLTSEDYTFNKREFKWKKARLIRAAKIEAKELAQNATLRFFKNIILNKTCVLEIHSDLRNQLLPDPTRFKGVDKLLQASKFNGTVFEEFFYVTVPWLTQELDGSVRVQMNTTLTPVVKELTVDGCNFHDQCHQYDVKVVDGDVHLDEWYNSRDWTYKITRVYYVPYHVFMAFTPIEFYLN